MPLTIAVHPMIEVDAIAGTLRIGGVELVRRVGDRLLTARLVDGWFVMAGGFGVAHRLDARASITSSSRVLAHWRGYVEGNLRCHVLAGGRW